MDVPRLTFKDVSTGRARQWSSHNHTSAVQDAVARAPAGEQPVLRLTLGPGDTDAEFCSNSVVPTPRCHFCDSLGNQADFGGGARPTGNDNDQVGVTYLLSAP